MANFNAKSKTAYNKIADNYDNSFDGKYTQKFKRLLTDHIVLEENFNVLDVACGNGSLLALLNKQKAINGFGIDISDQMIKNAIKNNPGMRFCVAGCEAIPFEDNTMDIITVSAAYHHFPDVKTFAREAKRVLKAKGKIYIAEVHLNAFLRSVCNPFLPLSKAGDVKFYSPNQIVDNFSRFGFEKVEVVLSNGVQIISMQKSNFSLCMEMFLMME